MFLESKSRKIRSPLGAIISKEVAARLNIEEGTTLHIARGAKRDADYGAQSGLREEDGGG